MDEVDFNHSTNLNVFHMMQEVKNMTHMMKDPKFMELFADYAKEMSDPNNRKVRKWKTSLLSHIIVPTVVWCPSCQEGSRANSGLCQHLSSDFDQEMEDALREAENRGEKVPGFPEDKELLIPSTAFCAKTKNEKTGAKVCARAKVCPDRTQGISGKFNELSI